MIGAFTYSAYTLRPTNDIARKCLPNIYVSLARAHTARAAYKRSQPDATFEVLRCDVVEHGRNVTITLIGDAL